MRSKQTLVLLGTVILAVAMIAGAFLLWWRVPQTPSIRPEAGISKEWARQPVEESTQQAVSHRVTDLEIGWTAVLQNGLAVTLREMRRTEVPEGAPPLDRFGNPKQSPTEDLRKIAKPGTMLIVARLTVENTNDLLEEVKDVQSINLRSAEATLLDANENAFGRIPVNMLDEVKLERAGQEPQPASHQNAEFLEGALEGGQARTLTFVCSVPKNRSQGPFRFRFSQLNNANLSVAEWKIEDPKDLPEEDLDGPPEYLEPLQG